MICDREKVRECGIAVHPERENGERGFLGAMHRQRGERVNEHPVHKNVPIT